ncbi:MAG: hypothetical protein A2017_02685 [Lentisphaerae bacterium GWF2_44_16]|nr:MAG: hypothetical protein A2017_02685 [Lentisphaerae bacterium GWF2_44_16]
MNKIEKEKKKYAAPAVDSMLDILEFMAKNPRPFGPTELSRTLGITTNLVFRVLKRLTERGYAEVNTEGTYKLSTRFFTLGMSLYSNFEIRRRARKHLEKLCEQIGETCQLQIPDGDKMLVVDTVNPSADFFLHVVPGSRVYYHANAFGKAVMAFMDESEVRKLLSRKMPALTENTITDFDKLREELKTVHETGIAYDNQEYINGSFCIGAPVFDFNGNACAGTGMTGMYLRFGPDRKTFFEEAVLNCADNISKDIGYTGDFFKNLKF